MYKYETHLHTSNCSACAVSNGYEMVDAAKEKGYAGFVVTNHFYHGNTCVDRNLAWEAFVSAYRADYELTRSYGEKMGIQVFFGIEEGFAAGKEMLIYGLSPEALIGNPEFIMLGAREKADFIRANGGVTVCAHPFRDRAYIPNPNSEPDPYLFDGIEGYNYANDPEENEKAVEFAKKNKLFITSGGDVHRSNDFGRAGIEFSEKIRDERDFVNKLKSGKFRLITAK